MLRTVIYILTIFFLSSQSKAEDFKPLGNFLSDSVKIGENIKYSLSFHHSKEMELFFPDSAYNYYPFEFLRKEYYPTVTANNISIDSVIYIFRTFEIRNSLDLSLPVFKIEHGDTTKIFSVSDHVFIKQYISHIPDSIKMAENTSYVVLNEKVNYPYLLLFSFLGIFILMLTYFVFGKTIIKNYRLYKIYRSHVEFIKLFDKIKMEFSKSPNINSIEKALVEWKNYLTKLEQKPINTYTTTEIISLFNKDELKDSLQIIDQSIYRGVITREPDSALNYLIKFSNKRYKKRRKEIRNV